MTEQELTLVRLAEHITHRFSPNYGWPADFVKATITADGGLWLRIGWGDVQIRADGSFVGAGTDLGKFALRGVLQNLVDLYDTLTAPPTEQPAYQPLPESPDAVGA